MCWEVSALGALKKKKRSVMGQGLPFELIHRSYNYLEKMFWMPTVPGKVLMSTSC